MARFKLLQKFGYPLIRTYSFVRGKRFYSINNLVPGIISKIKATGPITVEEYMKVVLTHPEKGYYMNRDVFGKRGDFITSPEISQVFGELIGVWVVTEWMMADKPRKWQLIELGPGRGTLMADMLRVFGVLKVPLADLSVHMIELSPTLSAIQEQTLLGNPAAATTVEQLSTDFSMDCEGPYKSCVLQSGTTVSWYRNLKEVPLGLSYIIAQEFFDALPIHQFQKLENRWREVLIGLNDKEELGYTLAPGDTPASVAYQQRVLMCKLPLTNSGISYKIHKILCIKEDLWMFKTDGEQAEISPGAMTVAEEIAVRVREQNGAALIIDYGKEETNKHTFRGFRSHQVCDPLVDPGSCDLTADVNFSTLKHVVSTNGVNSHGPITQNAFLHKMGIRERTEVLLKSATRSQSDRLVSDYEMLTSPKKMGDRYKFMAITRHQRHSPTPF